MVVEVVESSRRFRKVPVEVPGAGSGRFWCKVPEGSPRFRMVAEVPGSCRKFRKAPVQVAGAGSGGFPTALEGSGAEPGAGCKRRFEKFCCDPEQDRRTLNRSGGTAAQKFGGLVYGHKTET